MENRTLVNVLEDAQDIAVIKNLGDGRFVYAAKPSLQTQKHLYEISVSNPDDSQIPAFQEYWQFNEKQGIKGSSAYLALRFDSMALRPNGLWIPGLLEAKTLETNGKLKNGVYRDYGIVFYDDKVFNTEIARELLPEIEALGIGTPLITPFRALNPVRNNKMPHGVEFSFVESPRGIISGEDAYNKLSSTLDYRDDYSRILVLSRVGDGIWGAGWNDLDYSSVPGRVDWICGEATRSELKEAHGRLVEGKYLTKIYRLRRRIEEEITDFEESLNK